MYPLFCSPDEFSDEIDEEEDASEMLIVRGTQGSCKKSDEGRYRFANSISMIVMMYSSIVCRLMYLERKSRLSLMNLMLIMRFQCVR